MPSQLNKLLIFSLVLIISGCDISLRKGNEHQWIFKSGTDEEIDINALNYHFESNLDSINYLVQLCHQEQSIQRVDIEETQPTYNNIRIKKALSKQTLERVKDTLNKIRATDLFCWHNKKGKKVYLNVVSLVIFSEGLAISGRSISYDLYLNSERNKQWNKTRVSLIERGHIPLAHKPWLVADSRIIDNTTQKNTQRSKK